MKKGLFLLFFSLSYLIQAQETQSLLALQKPAYFYSTAQVGVIAGNAQAISINASCGYHFRFGLEAGVSIGREVYSVTHYPLLLETNYCLRNWKSGRAYAGIYGGLILNTSSYTYNRGVPTGCAGLRIGFTGQLTEHLGWTTSLGYRFMQLDEPFFYPYDILTDDYGLIINVNKHVAELRIGLELR